MVELREEFELNPQITLMSSAESKNKNLIKLEKRLISLRNHFEFDEFDEFDNNVIFFFSLILYHFFDSFGTIFNVLSTNL